jgi:hypothetical protein
MKKPYIIVILTILVLGVGIFGFYKYFTNNNTDPHIDGVQNNNTDATASNTNTILNTNVSETENTRSTMMRPSGICFDFIFNNDFVALPTNEYRMPTNIDPLKQLAKNWSWGTICPNLDTTNVFIVLVSKTAPITSSTQNTLSQTKKLYPKLSPEKIGTDEQSLYQVFLYADVKTELRNGKNLLTLAAEELKPISSIVWNQALAACWINAENIVSDKGITIQCGMGDNGCSNYERVRWNIFDTTKTYLGMCQNNCDLAPNESFVANCQ